MLLTEVQDVPFWESLVQGLEHGRCYYFLNDCVEEWVNSLSYWGTHDVT